MAWYDQGGDGAGRRPPQPDIEEALKKAGDFFKDFKKKGIAIGPIIIIIILLLLGLNSFYTVAPEEVGVVKRFGKVVRVATPGANFKIPLIEEVLKPAVTKVHRMEIGFRTVDPGPPARYRTINAEAHMLTGDENIVAVEFIIQFKI
ncbi:MAG: SPFH domain-containing protein, partial [Thermodesulfobacteriota bacterium]